MREPSECPCLTQRKMELKRGTVGGLGHEKIHRTHHLPAASFPFTPQQLSLPMEDLNTDPAVTENGLSIQHRALSGAVYNGLGGGFRNPNARLASKAQPAMTGGRRTEKQSCHTSPGVGPQLGAGGGRRAASLQTGGPESWSSNPLFSQG